MPEADREADPHVVLRFDGGRWICVEAGPAWRTLRGGSGPDVVGEPLGALLPDRFVAEALGRLCDLAALTTTVRRAPVPDVGGAPRMAIASPEAPAPDGAAPQIRLVLAAGMPSTLEEMHAALDRDSPELVAVFGLDLRVTDVNEDVVAVSGLSREQILGRTNAEMGYPAAVAELWDDHHRRVIETAHPHRVSYDLPTVLGVRHYESDIAPVLDARGAVAAVEVRSRDVTAIRLHSALNKPGSSRGEAVVATWDHFGPTSSASGAARRAVRRRLVDAGLGRFADTAELAVSELVTNAAMHAGTDIYVQVEHVGARVRIEVHDGSHSMPTVRTATTHGGRGLALVGLVAERWGAQPTPVGKIVWCEFRDGPPARQPVASPDSLIERWAEQLPTPGAGETSPGRSLP